jgi:multimeric flavodoxin WrbA
MKVLGIVCSPRARGNTTLLVNRLLEAAKQDGAETRLFHMASLNIGPCRDCKACKAAGKCSLDDDMHQVYEAIPDATGLVFGSPIYLDHITAPANIYIDRLYPYLGPALEKRFPKNVKLVTVLTWGAGNPSAYTYVGEWITRTLKVYFDLDTVDVIQAAGCNGVAELERRQDILDLAAAAGHKLTRAMDRA